MKNKFLGSILPAMIGMASMSESMMLNDTVYAGGMTGVYKGKRMSRKEWKKRKTRLRMQSQSRIKNRR